MFGRSIRISKRKGYFVGAAVLIGAIVWRFFVAPPETSAAVWKDISQPPPLGSSPPLNTSESFQTKSGALTLGGGLTISDPNSGKCRDNTSVSCSTSQDCINAGAGNVCVPHPDLVVGIVSNQKRICWNNVCKNNWNDVAGISQRYVQLNLTSPDSGWVRVQGLNASSSTQPAALKFTANEPTPGTPTMAVWGVSSPNSSDSSAGVYAQARANSTNNIALYGVADTSTTTTAWAGYFSGNVAIGSSTIGGVSYYYDLLVGGTRADGDNPGAGELCIRDTCRASWPPGNTGDPHWFDSGTLLQPKDTGVNLAVGGSNANAPFYLQNLSAQSEVQLMVKGTGTAATMTGTVVICNDVQNCRSLLGLN